MLIIPMDSLKTVGDLDWEAKGSDLGLVSYKAWPTSVAVRGGIEMRRVFLSNEKAEYCCEVRPGKLARITIVVE